MEKKEDVRLNKYLADQGVCSRREADRLIESGKVFVDGSPAGLGDRITMEMQVVVNGKAVTKVTKKVVLAFYKPEGVTCTEKDEHAEITITEYIKYPIRVTYAGRLDKDTEGLLLFTNDGDSSHKMMSPKSHIEKSYYCLLRKEIDSADVKKLCCGVKIENNYMTAEAEVEVVSKKEIILTITEGKYHQVKQMLEAVDNEVAYLKRVRFAFANLTLF